MMFSMNTKIITLKDIVELVIDYRGKTPKKLGGKWSEFGIKALSAKNIKNGEIVRKDSIRYVDEELYYKWMKNEIEKGDILLTSEAPFGEIYYWESDEKIVLSQRIFGIRCNSNKVYPKFIYFYMLSPMFQWELKSRATGTTVKGLRQPELLKCKLNIPDYDNQTKIAKILSNIENKIKVIKKINHNLDSILKNIFNEWFIKFSPFKGSIFKNSELGNIPMDWEIKSLQDISKNIICGKTPSTKNEEYWGDEIPFVTIPDMHNSIYVFNTERYLSKKGSESQIKKLIPPNSICVSCIATAGLVILTSKYCQTNQQINTIICEDNVSPYFIYLYMVNLSKYIQLLGSSGSTTNNLNKKEFSKIKIILPPNKIMKKFSNLVKPLFIKIKKNELEIEKLINLRDLLLPKLMSGEINVSKLK